MATNRVNWTRDDYENMVGLSGNKKSIKFHQRKRGNRKTDGKKRKRNLVQRGSGGRALLGGFNKSSLVDVLLAAVLTKVTGKLKKVIIDNMSKRQMDSIGKIIRSFLSSKVSLTPKMIKQLRKDRRYINALIRTKGKKSVPLNIRRRVLRQKGGFLSLALGALSPIIGGLLGKILK